MTFNHFFYKAIDFYFGLYLLFSSWSIINASISTISWWFDFFCIVLGLWLMIENLLTKKD
ncbi:hypothetical protein H3M14_08940 [Latilactobacillus sakei]|uniref:hypothetical protein n=1 Tax=Latilactobacillus sakei TaxID=1599 RepID=UPI00033A273B|nr:hypothetical protein [Latilactobacillus sakei]EOR85208.1 putative small protein [Latilactobacillus sakei subsp. sakei LS25]PKX63532.1 hypothetical protein CUR38_04245 [Latilactobacillus sakei]PKX67397.1 hypothetical protein CUR40_08875 [Latilactobacillus sakei]QMU86199.1 hypothetical protein H3M14_08940 [Latilactobacillus sakei]